VSVLGALLEIEGLSNWGGKNARLFLKNVKSDLFGIETRRLDEE
jgi:hypothetical protein